MTEIGTPAELARLLGVDWEFDHAQFAAVTAPLEPAVIIAGAGSGKTSVMAARVVWLVATGRVLPGEILGLTFTTKAAAELATRVRESLDRAGLRRRRRLDDDGEELPDDEPVVATYHAYAASLLTEHGLRIGHEPDTRLIADASRYQLAARAVQRWQEPVAHLTDFPPLVIAQLLRLDGELAEHLVEPDAVAAYDAAQRPGFVAARELEHRKTHGDTIGKAITAIDQRRELLDLVVAYRRLKAELGLMDYSDQIALAARLARECPEVGEAERERFKVVLLDEYQDTSISQAQMLSRLFSGPDPEHGLGHPVMAVGDPNQAIYGWRGASVSNILQFDRSFPAAGGPAARHSLTVNRRSDRRILDVANALAKQLYDEQPGVSPLTPPPGAAEGEVGADCHWTYDDELTALVNGVRAAFTALHPTRGPEGWRHIGVLTRDNSHAAHVFDRLTEADIPVEIVGLKGLLRLPEVAEVLATLHLVQDVTANAALLTLLTGPRWAIGVRDLALLGRRARDLAGPRASGPQDLDAALAAAVSGADPIEIPCLGDALESPGDLPYSAEALTRFRALADELRRLRGSIGEPILDLVRRILDVTGIDLELASSTSEAAAARRDNLDLFVQAVAEFQAIDGQVTLAALLAWLDTEDEHGQGLDVATPSEANSVKLLTVHRAKGLEWDAVFLPGVSESKFPTSRGRATALTQGQVLPNALRGDRADLAVLRGHDAAAIEAFKVESKELDRREELRLAYVAWTRAKHALHVSGYCWSTKSRSNGPSAYLLATREAIARWGAQPTVWHDKPAKGIVSPYAGAGEDLTWPIDHHSPEVQRRRSGATLWASVDLDAPDELEDLEQEERVQQWDAELERLVAEATAGHAERIEIELPSSLSATSLARLREDPAAFARDLARPMPRRPTPAARFGTRFHAWVESRLGQQLLLDPDDLPGRADTDVESEAELAELIAAFEAGRFAHRVPEAVEATFALVLAGQVVRGRIDAVFADGDGHLVVDWKTNRAPTADPLQLAIYRVAWAELMGVPLSRVRAGAYYVRTDTLVEPPDLPGREELERLIAG